MKLVPALVLASLLVGGCASTPTRAPDGSSSGAERASLQTQLAINYMREGKRDAAFQRLKRALEIDPGYAPAHNALGLVYEQLGQLDDAESHYARATQLDPAFASAQNNYGNLLCRRGQYEEAATQFKRAANNPQYRVGELAHYNAGLCLQRQGNAAAAADQFRTALRRNPKHAPSLLAMSEASLAQGNHLSARGYLQRYLEVGRHSPRTLWLGVRIERVLGDKNAVSSYSMLLKSKYPESSETQRLIESESR